MPTGVSNNITLRFASPSCCTKPFSQNPFFCIRLESNHFKADTSIGMKELVAVENFTGCPFVIQFGCQFTGEAPYGNFGSVFVEQPSQYGGNKSILSFLLNKVCYKKYFQIDQIRSILDKFAFKVWKLSDHIPVSFPGFKKVRGHSGLYRKMINFIN